MQTFQAIKKGILIPLPCKCGTMETQAHHKDYRKPLDIEWLCKECHYKAHGMSDSNNRDVNRWMEENSLTIWSFAQATGYSFGASAKWRSGKSYPSARAEKEIARTQKRRGWTPFPPRPA